MNCPHCKQTIDDDSFFCDQCGEEILVCSTCGRPGKGKRCIFDGEALVKPGTATPTPTPTPTPTTTMAAPKTASPMVPPPVPVPAAPASTIIETTGAGLRIRNAAQGIDLTPTEGDVLGRKTGAFVPTFGRFPQVSGTHLRFEKVGAAWCVTDLGSLNGTSVNGRKLAPHAPTPLSHGGELKIADLVFAVELSGSDDVATVRS